MTSKELSASSETGGVSLTAWRDEGSLPSPITRRHFVRSSGRGSRANTACGVRSVQLEMKLETPEPDCLAHTPRLLRAQTVLL